MPVAIIFFVISISAKLVLLQLPELSGVHDLISHSGVKIDGKVTLLDVISTLEFCRL